LWMQLGGIKPRGTHQRQDLESILHGNITLNSLMYLFRPGCLMSLHHFKQKLGLLSWQHKLLPLWFCRNPSLPETCKSCSCIWS
jgi:hypothetical protein